MTKLMTEMLLHYCSLYQNACKDPPCGKSLSFDDSLSGKSKEKYEKNKKKSKGSKSRFSVLQIYLRWACLKVMKLKYESQKQQRSI
ncbi:CLUMA_CG015509, isoform A [Clunio marinus]|uniref:CLUMA_CG015509, isoform A n=1 Tax=Clunio marinus TaxID=568069 RepID=A0A1J1IRQ1_9DIPT|nr:CLUMA_CG015509, isoform A [Clunio marinus]